MVNLGLLKPAFEKLYSAALVGSGWEDALEDVSRFGGSRGVVIMHNRNRRIVAAISNTAINEPLANYVAGKSPPNSRQTKVSHDFDPGFRIDQDDYDSGDMARDQYYQDYLRPLGLFWHANARLKTEGSDEVAVGFKRELKSGPYEEADKAALDLLLPHVRACARITECVFDAETRGLVRGLHRGGRPVLEFDAWGRVRQQHGNFDGTAGPLSVRSGRAVAAKPQAQNDLEKAIARATDHPQRSTALLLNDSAGNSHVFQIVPIFGQARDVFLSTSAVGVLISRTKRNRVTVERGYAMDLFGLTLREAQIVDGLCRGYSIRDIATELRVVPETVRFHLKSVFEKTGAHRQAEVVALFAQLIY